MKAGPLTAWWGGLSGRERLLLGIGLGAVGLTVLYLGLLEPLQTSQTRLQAQVAAEAATLARVRALASEAGQLQQGATPRGTLPGAQSLLAVLNDAAQSGGIQSSIERVVPNGAGEASVTFEDIAFDALAAWLVDLRTRFGIEASRLVIDKGAAPGRVNANLTLVAGG